MNPAQTAMVLSILQSSDVAVARAMVILLSFQTEGERAIGTTVESNGVGFSGATDKNGTYFAKWVLGLPQNTSTQHMSATIKRFLDKDEPGRALTGKFLVRARKIACLHRKQLASLLPKFDLSPITRRYTTEEEIALFV